MAPSSPSSADDSDLEDLIAKSPSNQTSVDAAQTGSSSPSSTPSLLHYTPLHLLCNLFQLTTYTFANRFPILSRVLTTLLLFSLLGLLTNTLVNPTSASYHRLGADYSSITSAYDLSLSHVHHWCIEGDNDSCKCEDPLEPHPRSEFKSWNAAHKANVAEVEFYRAVYGMEPTAVDKELGRPRARLDVAFLGESVVEAMDGRWLGKKVVSLGGVSPGPDGVRVEGKRGEEEEEGEIKKKRTKSIDQIFEHFFRKDKGGYFEGCALGIAGDTTSNVLWRIQNNEMPYDFNPKVWWLLLGMNDLTRMQCSEEIVVLGILRVVEEIRLRKPDAKIVINSLLPMVNFDEMKKGDEEVKMADFADFQAKDEKGRHKYRKRQIPVDMDENNDDDRVKNKRKNDGKRRLKLQNRVLRNKQFNNKNDDNEEEIPARRAKNDKRPEQEPEPRGKTRKERLKEIDNATSGPLLEKAMERKRKYLATHDKKVRDKVFKDDEKYHPKKPISPFLPLIKKHVLPPVWPSVHLINDKLKEFCKKHDGITFFDATPIFASDEGNGKHRLYDELISPRGHPTELGFQQWEGHIMSRLHKLLAESEDEKEVVKKVPEPKMEQEEEDYQDGEDAVEGNEMEAKDGEGSEHVSEGKEAMPPEEGNGSMPDRRADPPAEAEEDEYEDENDDDDDEDSE